MTWKPDTVIYHKDCADGFGAAWACWLEWPEAEYIEAQYGDAPPDVTDRNVLIVDFSYKRDVLLTMAGGARSVVILDHHKTAEADLSGFMPTGCTLDTFRAFVDGYDFGVAVKAEFHTAKIAAFFDMERSGARLAWEFAHPGQMLIWVLPELTRLIEDRDLWRFQYPETRAFSASLRTQPKTFETWSNIDVLLSDAHTRRQVMASAHDVLAYHNIIVDGLVRGASAPTSSRAPAIVNCPGVFASDVGNALLRAFPEAAYAMTYSDGVDGKRHFSLRSEDGREDVSEIAKTYGGGGHRNAAGFAQPAPVVLI